jgi:mono/diheme cytochrome c family protein
MRTTRIVSVVAVAALVAGMGPAANAAGNLDFGKLQYDSNCAVCHGKLGKGDGPFAGMVDTRAGADITTLSRRNGGVFPFARVYEIIDGREEVRFHGTREMPIWGHEYQARAAADYGDVPHSPEIFARLRIVAVTDYLYRLQAK